MVGVGEIAESSVVCEILLAITVRIGADYNRWRLRSNLSQGEGGGHRVIGGGRWWRRIRREISISAVGKANYSMVGNSGPCIDPSEDQRVIVACG